MNTVERLFEKNRQVIELDGMEFLCHRWSFALAVEAFGAAALGLVNDGDGEKVDTKDAGQRAEMVRKALSVAMIEPRLGENDDLSKGVVTMRTLGDYAYKLFGRLVDGDMEKAGNFRESSEGRRE